MDATTESTSIRLTGNFGRTFSKTTDVNDARMGMYEYAYGKTTEVTREPAGLREERAERTRKPGPGTPGDRYVLRELEEDAALKASDMEEAAERGDKVDLGLAAMELLDDLRELWQRKTHRSEEWAMVLNFLQIALSGEDFEGFDPARCRAVRSVIEKHLSYAATQDDIDQCVACLEQAGLDPWKPMTAFRE